MRLSCFRICRYGVVNAAALLVLFQFASSGAFAYDYVGRAISGFDPAKGDRVEKLLWSYKLDYVRLERSQGIEPAATLQEGYTDKPVQDETDVRELINIEFIGNVLSQLKLNRKNKTPIQLFRKKDIKALGLPLIKALKIAGPQQDVVFGIAGRSSGVAFFSESLYTTGRLFIRNNQLNIILGDTLKRFEGEVRATGVMPVIKPALRSRQADGRIDLVENEVIKQVNGRTDWVRINMVAIATGQTDMTASRAGQWQQNLSVNSSRSDGVGKTNNGVRQKLLKLKQLWKEELITDSEYKEYKRKLLKQL